MPTRSLNSSVLKWPNKGIVLNAIEKWSRHVLQNHAGVKGIGFFGSYARGDSGVGSDLDLILVLDSSGATFERRAAEWDTTGLPVPVDLLVYTEEEWRALDRERRFTKVLEKETVWIYNELEVNRGWRLTEAEGEKLRNGKSVNAEPKTLNSEPAHKCEIAARFDGLAERRGEWIERNRYYYEDQKRYYRFLVPEGASVLELGCGTGDLLDSLKPRRGVGIDISSEMVAIARRKFPNLEFRHADIERVEPWGETFDFIVLADVVGHLQDIEEALLRLRSFCRPDTRFIISYYSFLWEPILKAGEKVGLKMPQQYQNWLSTEDICNLLTLAHYQVVKTESRLLLPKSVPLLSEFINRYVASLPGIRRLSLCRYIVARPLNLKGNRSFTTSVVIPCRNEKGNIEEAVSRLSFFGDGQEIVFVEGGSTDGTREEIERVIAAFPEKDIKMLVQDGRGKGDAVRKGFASAKGDILMILDADLTVPPEDLTKFYRALADDVGEFINGCRLVYPMEKEAMRFLNLLGNKFFSVMFTWILNQRFKDTLCGTKALFKQDYDKIQANRGYFGDFDPFGDFDLIFGAVKQNLKVVEVPIRYKERTYGATNISRFRHGWLLLKMTLFAYRRIKAI